MPDRLTASDLTMFTPQVGMFPLLLLAASFSDLKRREIPDRLQPTITSFTFLPLSPGNLWGILGALPYLLVAPSFGDCGGIGGGDIKLAAATGLVLGLPASLTASTLGLGSVCLVYGLIAVRRRLHGEKEKILFPMGPFLVAGVAVTYLMKIGGLIL